MMEPIELNLPGKTDFFTQEAYKVLRTNLQFCGQDIKVIALTSCNENEGKSTVSLHIGRSFAELGKKVLVIDADMRKSVIAGRNTTASDPKGLSEVLSGLCRLEDCLYPVEDLPMTLLFSGKYPPNPVELLSGKYFAGLIENARAQYDIIIIDTPPLGQVIDAAVIASNCDGMVLVFGAKKIPYRQAQEVVDQIKKSGCRLLGAVRNNQRKPEGKKYHKRYYRQD